MTSPVPQHRAPRFLKVLVCLALGGLAGCKLIDQRTFDRDAGIKPVPVLPPAAANGPKPIPPLFVVQANAPDATWQPGLREAVHEALARKPNVLFTVDSVVPAVAAPATEATSMQAAVLTLGRPVADAIVADGARPEQVELAAASDPALRRPEVRIAVR